MKLLKSSPNHSDANHLRGLIVSQRGEYDLAAQLIDRAIRDNPGQPMLHYNLGLVKQTAGKSEQALHCYEQALRINPDFTQAHNNRGNALKDLGKFEDAMGSYERAIRISPNYAEAHNNRGSLLNDLGRKEEALEACEQAIRINPDYAEAYTNRGNILRNAGRLEEAIANFRRALQINPDLAEIHNNYGNALRDMGSLNDALKAYKRALKINPDYVEAHSNCGNVFVSLGDLEAAGDSYRHALKIRPADEAIHSNLVFLLALSPHVSPETLLEEQRIWDKVHGQQGRLSLMPARAKKSISEARLRIGYVSPDLHTHAVSNFLEPMLNAHDRESFEIFCYDTNSIKADETTARLREISEHWRPTGAAKDEDLARLIHEDHIDILVDLAGHTSGNSLRTFTYKPAPVQATYLGFFAASGLSSMDYWITDEVLHPAETSQPTIETLYRLPRCAFCYQAPAEVPAISPCPGDNGQVVFGSFSNHSKLTTAVLETWSRLLTALPDSRLLLTTKALGDPTVRHLLLERFRRFGITENRLLMQYAPDAEDWFATYAQVDIVLDPFPRTGCTTTAEALWMGVPVVTLAGKCFAGRASATVLTATGLPELIANNREDYITIAVLLARDPARRAQLRNNLRRQMSQSPLCDGKSLANAMENAYKTMWEQYITS